MMLKVNAPLDPGFAPMVMEFRAFEEAAEKSGGKKIVIGIERNKGYISTYEMTVFEDGCGHDDDNFAMAERIVKTLLWARGGYKIIIAGSDVIGGKIKEAYDFGGLRDFDRGFMARVYERPFEVESVPLDKAPKDHEAAEPVGRHLEGCRIGFDAGGSDRKVSAVIDGETVYSEEVVWFPKTNSDPDYHYDGIVAALKSAAAHMPRVDAVGVSSAGVYINDRTMNASLFLKVPQELFDAKVKDIYIRAITDTFGDVPFCVFNDGDVTALAGAISLEDTNILGIAMGTSEAGGYVDENGYITGWLNELAFIPVDANPGAMRDEWSLDIGCGVKYFSQDGVIKLAPAAGIELDEVLSPAEKLKAVQALMNDGDGRAAAIYRSIGVYLAHSLALYHDMYHFRHVLLLGRVMSGRGGELIISECERVLRDEYGELAEKIHLALPDEKFRRVGQSAAAASLPENRK